MKFSILAIGTLLAATGLAAPAQTEAAAKTFKKVPLAAPNNWQANSNLFPGDVIEGYSADLDKYDAESWAQHVLAKCKGFAACTSSNSYSAINSGTPKKRYWFGYVYRGGPTTQKDYTREKGVQGSYAYTIVKN